jgi:hypothetical protein
MKRDDAEIELLNVRPVQRLRRLRPAAASLQA